MTLIGVFVIYSSLTLFAFSKLPFTFFQQDEWAIFGNYIYWEKTNLDWFQRLFIYKQTTHLIPLSNLVSYFQFKLLGLDFFFYGAGAITVHFINSFLVFYLSYLLLKRKDLSFFSGLLFLINSISHQGFTWIATTIGTAGSAFFILISLIFFTKYLICEKSKTRNLALSLLFFAVSLFFKETSIFIFLFYPLFWLIYRQSFSEGKRVFLAIFLLGVFYGMLRLYFLLAGFTSTSSQASLSQPDFLVYLYRILTSPLKFITQGILPQEQILKFAEAIIYLAYPFQPNFLQGGAPNPYISQSVASDLISYAFAVGIILISLFLGTHFRRNKEDLLRKTLVLALSFIILSSLPFVFIPGRAGYFSLIDGRHLYITEVFTSILLAVLGFGLYSFFKKKKAIALILIIIFLGLSFFHIKRVRNNINYQVDVGFTRRSILNKIYNTYPRLPQKVVFYLESDKAYYGLPPGENIVPFQSGFGQNLLVWYNAKSQDFPACLFLDQYLYVQLSQGYKECENKGFGYFRKKQDLKQAIFENNIKEENIIGFSYNSSSNTLVDITHLIRDEVKR